MIHQSIFTTVEQTRLFQEKMQWTIGNIVLDGPVTVTINSKIPVSHGLTEEPAYHQILIQPGIWENYMQPQNFQTIEDPDFYEELMDQNIGKLDDWKELILLTEGRTLKIWGPSIYKMCLPFSRTDYDSLEDSDIMDLVPDSDTSIDLQGRED